MAIVDIPQQAKSALRVFKWIAIVVVLLVLISAFAPFAIVGAGQRGVILTWGAVGSQVLDEGLHLRTPIAQQVIKMDVTTQKLEVTDSQAYSKDLQVVQIHSVLNWNIDPQFANTVYQTVMNDVEGKVVNPNMEVAIKQTVAKYTAEELLAKRQEVQDEIEKAVRDSTAPSHVLVTHYALVNENFSQDYEAAIERKQVAEQDALTAKNKLAQVQFEADQRVAQAKGEAEAIKIQAEAITQQGGANYVQLQAIKQWDGKLPTQFVPGSAVPFLNLK